MKRRRLALGGACVVLLVGCGTPMQFLKNSRESFPPRRSPAEIEVHYTTPAIPFVSVGVINWQYYRPGFREPFITDALPAMQEKAAAEGGDALIVRGHSVLESSPRVLRVMADVIRFAP